MDFTQQIEDLDRRTDIEARRCFEEKRKLSAPGAVRKGVAGFRKVYFLQKACRQGVPGLFRAVQEGMFHFLTYAKYWELERNRRAGD